MSKEKIFLSDHCGTICEAVMDGLLRANEGQCAGFGDDKWTAHLDAVFGSLFETDLISYPVVTGSAANSLILCTLCPPYGAILCYEEAHIQRDECGAPEFFTGGAKLALVHGENGKINPEALKAKLASFQPVVHQVKPKVLSITQATELGTVYTLDEISRLSEIAHAAGLKVHLDGARLHNAIVNLGCSWADATWRAGVDALSFSSTKNGTMCGEAAIFFDRRLAEEFPIWRKRGGHHLSKMRYLSAQITSYIESGSWDVNARRTNELASMIASAAGPLLAVPVEANQVFMILPTELEGLLEQSGFRFMAFYYGDQRIGRFVVSWDQHVDDITELAQLLEGFVSNL